MKDSHPPAALPVLPRGIPAVLRTRHQWVLWRYDRTKDGWGKVPYRADGRGKARSNDPATWGTFDAALARYAADRSWAGLGYVFAADDPFCGVDLDDCVFRGEVSAPAWALLARLCSYAEVSPSGTGVKAVFEAARPEGRCSFAVLKPGLPRVEVYDQGRYFALTGRRVPLTPAGVRQRQEAIEALYRERFGAPAPPAIRTPRRPIVKSSLDAEARAAAYVARCEPAISGQNGHGRTFAVARAVVWGFALGAQRGFALLWASYNPICRPPWSERELMHKCVDAETRPSEKPRGWLLA